LAISRNLSICGPITGSEKGLIVQQLLQADQVVTKKHGQDARATKE
jgi:hypothetical protein